MKQVYVLLFCWVYFWGLTNVCNVAAQTNQYLHLDGKDDSVVLPDASQYLVGATGFTMAGWFYTDELRYGQGMLDFRGASDDEFYVIQLDNGVLECRWIPKNSFYEIKTPQFTILPEQWQHLAFVFTGTAIELYIDGELKGSETAGGAFTDATVDFSIGESVVTCCDFYYGGGIDEVTLWSKALTADDIKDMMQNELQGNEASLELYYKFNQGVPEEDNSSIMAAISEVDAPNRNANLSNIALSGTTSNFVGELDLGFQAITFAVVPDVLTSDGSFEISAAASSGLPVSFSIASGPATITGNTITLTGEAGEVAVVASQAGDDTYEAAVDVVQTFQILDPQNTLATVEMRNPLEGEVYVSELLPIQLAAVASIDYPALFNVAKVYFQIGDKIVEAKDWGNGHYTAWWQPSDYGNHVVIAIAENNFEAKAFDNLRIELLNNAEDKKATAIEGMILDGSVSVGIVEAELPAYLGAYDQIIGTLDVNCSPDGCDPWDRVAQIEAKGHNGEWIEIIRYITSYGKGCDHIIDLTDFMSILQGKVTFKITYITFAEGFEFNLNLDYRAGTPAYAYSNIQKLWEETYDFGNYANLQPVEMIRAAYPANTEASKLKLVSTGHGWYGDGTRNNTENAAEFYDATHNILVNGEATFEQHNWLDCNPNPDGCNDQFGTWQFNRAGWCPGAIAPWFNYDMTDYIEEDAVDLNYRFYEDYVDLCNPNHPNCESNTPPQCDCSAGFNPHLIVASSLISYGKQPLALADEIIGIEDFTLKGFQLYPNPTNEIAILTFDDAYKKATIEITNNLGKMVYAEQFSNITTNYKATLNLKNFAKGIYIVSILTERGKGVKKLVVE